MSLQVWLPLIGDTHNQGCGNYTITTVGTLSWVSGKIGNTAMRAGTGEQVTNGLQLNTNFVDLLNGDYSVAVWVKPYGNHVHYNGSIISSGNWNTPNKRWAFGVNQANTQVDVLCNNYNTYIDCPVPVNTWTHLVCTCGQDRKIKLYKNGSYVGVVDRGTNTFDSDASVTYIGRESYASGYFSFNGAVQDFRLYNNCLSEQEVKEISKGLILHYPLNRRGFGQDNLATCATQLQSITASSTNNYAYNWINSSTLEPNTTYTFSAEAESDNLTKCTVYNYTSSGNSGSINHNFPVDGKRHSWTFTTTTTGLGVIAYAGNAGSTAGHSIQYKNIKIEKGTKATPYVPKTNEPLYTDLGLNNTNAYDVSGYNYNGTKYNITYETDTPKYDVSSVFKSADTSYIKVNDNKWMPQYQEAMTINLWAYSTNWASTTKLFSCTESGGWNTEGGNSGYIRFPIYVATNSAQTSYAYKYNSQELKISDLSVGWHMLTFIYDSTGNKVYVDGQLHSSYAFTSYGIRYNTNARLFLGCEANTASPYAPYFNGKLSDFRIYATALTSNDVLSLYNNGAYIDSAGNIHGKIR